MKTRLGLLKEGDIFTIVSGARYRFLGIIPNGKYRVEKIGETVDFQHDHSVTLLVSY